MVSCIGAWDGLPRYRSGIRIANPAFARSMCHWLAGMTASIRVFMHQRVNFPLSVIFLERIEAYHATLEHYSRPRLALTEWEATPDLNVRVLNETRDLFRFFDATIWPRIASLRCRSINSI
jgi:hypothetical protein